jgi:uncharacterized protein HemY/transglutaminase-like putative cysteine protease
VFLSRELRAVRSLIVAVVFTFSACSGFAQTKPAPTPASSTADASYAGEAQIIEQWDTNDQYNADGTGVEDVRVRVKVQNEAGARQYSVLSIGYAAATTSAQYVSVRVTHADGTSTDTPPTDAIDMPAPVTQQAPLYSDLKSLQLPVRGLRAGDTLEYHARIQRKAAEAPGEFWDSDTFVKSLVVLSQTLTLDVPADKYVEVWSPTVKPVLTEAGGRRIYKWSGSQLKPTSQDKKTDGSAKQTEDNKPTVAWTTFHSWQQIGDWYRGLAEPRAVPTDALRAQADEITRDAKTPEEQIQAIYSYVATRIRYIGIDFGIGRYEPHAAPEVFANQYGDCKDKDTLLEALLHAKGFTTAPALIGVNLDLVPELPSPGQFNHVITTVELPSGRIWLDSTPETAPFRMLVSVIRDKQALVIPSSGAASLERTPAQPPFPFVDRFEATATLNADGDLNGHVDINDRSDSEIALRAIARNIAPAQWDQATQYLANLMGFSGTTSNSNFARADDLSVPMHISYDYTRKSFGDWATFRIVPLFPVVELPEAPDKKPSDDIDLGAQRTEIAVSQIHLPTNFGADLPDAVHVKMPFATFDKTYNLENGTLTTKRTVVILQPKLPANSWEDYKKFADDVSLGQENFIQLTETSVSGSGPHPPKPGENNLVAAQLVSQAQELEQSNDLRGALKKLDEAKEIQPVQPYLWSNYGWIAMRQNKRDEAKKDFLHELELYPDESYVVLIYSAYLHRLGDNQEALSVLSDSFKNDPSQEQVALMLASLQVESSVPDAIATLRRAETASTNSKNLPTALAQYLIRDHENAEASTILKKQLADADDPLSLNNESYLLAEAGTDLPFAEQKTRQALDMLNTQSSEASIGEANAQSFNKSSLLVATWDTLGYILMQENRLDDARGYFEAAWANRTTPDVGDHYGHLLEKLGKPGEALQVYQIAVDSGSEAPGMPELRDAKDAVARLKKAGTKPVDNGAITSLQKDRTFTLPLKSAHKTYVSATFRLQFTAGAAPEVMRVSGNPTLDAASDAIRKLHLPQYVPAQSTARLLRDAVVTCSPGEANCYFVLMPLGSINAETAN